MRRWSALAAAAVVAIASPALADPSAEHPGEEAVKPYVESNANAGAKPMSDQAMLRAFHGKDGIGRISAALVDRAAADPRIAEIFKAQDLVRLKRTLAEQICYLLGGGCDYSGRDMAAAHADLGIQNADFNALVEDLQWAMSREGVPFRAQNRLLAKLAPMQKTVVQR